MTERRIEMEVAGSGGRGGKQFPCRIGLEHLEGQKYLRGIGAGGGYIPQILKSLPSSAFMQSCHSEKNLTAA